MVLHSRQAWRLLGRLARRELEEAAVRLATHEPQAAFLAVVRLEDSVARPAMPVGAFVGWRHRLFARPRQWFAIRAGQRVTGRQTG